MGNGGRIALALLAGLALAAFLLHGRHVPARWNPLEPLAIEARPNLLTRYKLARLDGAQCMEALADTPLVFMPLPDRAGESGCGHSNVVRIAASSVALGQPATLSCRTAASLALWERHVLQPEAIRRFDQRVAAIEHYGSYACRNIAGSGRRSRHATADAFDIAALKLADGTRISVREHWSGDDPRSRFLHALRSGACRWFDGVLSPDYNAAHHDHLHVERGGGRICR